MSNNADIVIESKGELRIHIHQNNESIMANAFIVTGGGEVVEKIVLNNGENIVNITPYLLKNYAIKIVNGKNITMQKI